MTIRNDTDEIIAFLNGLAKIDPKAMGDLLKARVPCNEALADHPTVQVAAGGENGYLDLPPDQYRVGFLGILNGFAGKFDDGPLEGSGPIAAVVEDDGTVSSFRRTDAPKLKD